MRFFQPIKSFIFVINIGFSIFNIFKIVLILDVRLKTYKVAYQWKRWYFQSAFVKLLDFNNALYSSPIARKNNSSNKWDYHILSNMIEDLFYARSENNVWPWRNQAGITKGKLRHILGDPGAVSEVGRKGATNVFYENFRRAFSPGPTDRPWVSEDDLDTTEEKFEKWSSLFQEIKKMITKKRMRHKYIRQLKNKERLENIKKRVKLTRNQERLVQAESATIIGEITDLQE